MPRKPFKERLGRLALLVLVAAGTIWLIRYLNLSGPTGTAIELIIILAALLLFVL